MKRSFSMKKTCVAVWLLLSASGLWAQSSSVLDEIIENKSISWSQGAYLALVGSGQLAESASPQQGFEQLSQLGWVPFFTGPDSHINLSDYSYLLARIWSEKADTFTPRFLHHDTRSGSSSFKVIFLEVVIPVPTSAEQRLSACWVK